MTATDKDIADQLATIKNDMSALIQSVTKLASETDSIKRGLGQRFGDAAKVAVDAGDWLLDKAESVGGDAVNLAGRGAVAAMSEVQGQIERNPLSAVLIAMGCGLAVGFLGRGTTPVVAVPHRGRR